MENNHIDENTTINTSCFDHEGTRPNVPIEVPIFTTPELRDDDVQVNLGSGYQEHLGDQESGANSPSVLPTILEVYETRDNDDENFVVNPYYKNIISRDSVPITRTKRNKKYIVRLGINE